MTARRVATWALLGFMAGMLCSWPFLSRADVLNVKIDGVTHAVDIPYEALWWLRSPPSIIWFPLPDAGTASARTATGNVWTIDSNGAVFLDGVPVPPPASAPTWVKMGKDFDTVTIATASTCRYGVEGKYVALTLVPGSYVVKPDTFGVADPAFQVVKSLDCQMPGAASKAQQLTSIGAQLYGKFAGAWKRYTAGQWVDASTSPTAMLENGLGPVGGGSVMILASPSH